jgi:hypothetical protein
MHDPLDLLISSPGAPADVYLRRRLLDRTLGEVRRGRRWRRFQGVAALAGSFVAGFFTLAALLPPPTAAPDRPAPPAGAGTGNTALVTPVDLEWQALDRPAEASALYKRAGDDYLRQGEHADALRCYGNALDEASPGDLEVSGDDSWLLIAIKHARKKEMEQCARE